MKLKLLFPMAFATIASLGNVQSQILYVPNGTIGIGTSTNGNVGIGTNTPSSKLTIVDGFVESSLSNAPGQGQGLAGFTLTSTKTTWNTYIAAPDGGFGVAPQNYEYCQTRYGIPNHIFYRLERSY